MNRWICPGVGGAADFELVGVDGKRYSLKSFAFLAINPNDAEAYPEDSLAMMKVRGLEWGINFPYLFDETQEIAKKYKAQCTQDIYVFDRNRRLFYHGRINDNWRQREAVTEESLKQALEDLLVGKAPVGVQKPSMGCSIKWRD